MMDRSDNFSSFEIKLEIDELIIKDELENVTNEHNIDFKFDMNLPTNTKIKMDPSMCSNFPKDVATLKMDDSFNSKLKLNKKRKIKLIWSKHPLFQMPIESYLNARRQFRKLNWNRKN